MLATKLFPETFRTFQRLLARNQLLETNILNTTINPLTQFHISNVYAITNLISKQLADLQSQYVIGFLNNIIKESKTLDLHYDENKHLFTVNTIHQYKEKMPLLDDISQIKKEISSEENNNNQKDILTFEQQKDEKFLQITIKVYNCRQQKYDHPSVRQSLYFHQLKDLDKYLKYSFLPKTPLMVQQMNRKKLQIKYLDKKNPYGIPDKAPPLLFDVQFDKKVYIRIKSTYQQTNIKQVGFLKQICTKNGQKTVHKHKISGMRLPRQVQDLLYKDILEKTLNMDDAYVLNLHKLAYIGGRVEKLNLFMNVHEAMCIDNEDIFQQLMEMV